METQKQLDERLTRIQGEIHDFKKWLESTIEFETNLDNSEYMRGYVDGLKTILKQLEERGL